jgi:hypothetical protein
VTVSPQGRVDADGGGVVIGGGGITVDAVPLAVSDGGVSLGTGDVAPVRGERSPPSPVARRSHAVRTTAVTRAAVTRASDHAADGIVMFVNTRMADFLFAGAGAQTQQIACRHRARPEFPSGAGNDVPPSPWLA